MYYCDSSMSFFKNKLMHKELLHEPTVLLLGLGQELLESFESPVKVGNLLLQTCNLWEQNSTLDEQRTHFHMSQPSNVIHPSVHKRNNSPSLECSF